MGNIFLAIWLILFGVLSLVPTDVPKWVLGLAAVITGLVIALEGWKARKP